MIIISHADAVYFLLIVVALSAVAGGAATIGYQMWDLNRRIKEDQ